MSATPFGPSGPLLPPPPEEPAPAGWRARLGEVSRPVLALAAVAAVAVVALAGYLLLGALGSSGSNGAGGAPLAAGGTRTPTAPAATPSTGGGTGTPAPTASGTPLASPPPDDAAAQVRDPFAPLILPPAVSTVPAGLPVPLPTASVPGYPLPTGFPLPVPTGSAVPTPAPSGPVTLRVVSIAADSQSAVVLVNGARTTVRQDDVLGGWVTVYSIMTPVVTFRPADQTAFDLAIGATRRVS